MGKGLKSILKSVRLTDEVFSYVQSFEGNGFNEKFENLVLFCMKSEKAKRERLDLLDKRIAEKSSVMDSLREASRLLGGISAHLSQCDEKLTAFLDSVPDMPAPAAGLVMRIMRITLENLDYSPDEVEGALWECRHGTLPQYYPDGLPGDLPSGGTG